MLRLAGFDFDNTLFRSPDRPPGWDFEWWANPISLGRPCVPDKPGSDWWNSSIVGEAKKAISDSDTYAIMMTGRIDKRFRWRVPELLKQAGLSFDEVHLNPGGDTLGFKKKKIYDTLRKFPAIDTVEFWEDRSEHMPAFIAFITKMDRTCVPHNVKPMSHEIMCSPEEVLEYRTAHRIASRQARRQRQVRLLTFADLWEAAARHRMATEGVPSFDDVPKLLTRIGWEHASRHPVGTWTEEDGRHAVQVCMAAMHQGVDPKPYIWEGVRRAQRSQD